MHRPDDKIRTIRSLSVERRRQIHYSSEYFDGSPVYLVAARTPSEKLLFNVLHVLSVFAAGIDEYMFDEEGNAISRKKLDDSSAARPSTASQPYHDQPMTTDPAALEF